MKTHFLNGALVSDEKLFISPRDIGFSRGFAVFDFLKTYPHHRPFKLEEHLDRLYNSARLIGLEVPWSKEEMEAWVMKTLAANQTSEEKFIKIIVSGGVSDTMFPRARPTIIIMVDPAVQYPTECYEKGVGVITVKHERYNPAAKSNNYIEGVKQTQLAAKVGAVEPVYYSDTQVFEGSNSNIFTVIGNSLLTPRTDILEGVTRNVLLQILRLPIPVQVKDFTMDEFCGATEAFLTGSGKEITPITSVDGKPLGDGTVGPITKDVMRQFREYTLSDLW
ncbi:MAG: aminotransferase class IV [bacterium]|nr:aminotransferase class IV [bacterium]MDZ4285261.1 aminotransferase class IV [Patescibacteria group bacterium]